VYGSLALLESLIGGVNFMWLPLYFIGKVAFLIWCFHPQTKGALIVYNRVLQPLFGQMESKVAEVEREESRGSVTSGGGSSQRNSLSQQRGSTSQKAK